MSDGERGPYTPPREREAPLQFDARGPRDAKPMPMALMASAAVLVLLIGGVAVAYLGGSRGAPADKTVGDRVLVMKTPPTPGANPAPDPNAKLEVFSDHAAAGAPTFTPAPEAPAPRPAPRLTLQEQTLPPVRIAAPEATAVATPKPVAAASPVKPAPVAPKAAASVAATDLSTARTTVSTPKTAAVTATGPVGAQIGAFSSRGLAEQGYADVGKLVSIAGRGKRIEAVERGDSTLYRTTVTGFADRDAAKAFCSALTAKGHACIVKG